MKREDIFIKGSVFIEDFMSTMDEKSIKDQLIGVYKRNCIDFETIEHKENKLSLLNKQINDVREILNEVCCTVDTIEAIKERLIISQYLDGLIAEYMKELNYINKY